MSLISMKFLIFVLVCVLGYYIIPKKFQWMWLLVFSYIYFLSHLKTNVNLYNKNNLDCKLTHINLLEY